MDKLLTGGSAGDYLSAVREIVSLTSADNVGSFLSIVGAGLLIGSGLLAFQLIKTNPNDIKGWQKLLLVVPSIMGLLFVIAGPSLSLLRRDNEARVRQRLVTNRDAFQRLRDNAEVKWLIRLIPYDPLQQQELSLDRLKYLGPPGQRYSFVADYDELRGYTVQEAVEKTGLPFESGQRVTAIIFPLLRSKANLIIPVSARGLLQLIDRVEKPSILKQPLNLKQQLSPNAYDNLSRIDINSYTWNNYKPNYREYCEQARVFRCGGKDRYTAANLMGTITKDWHPLGFARQVDASYDPCPPAPDDLCRISDWPDYNPEQLSKFGVRVFMTENVEVTSLQGRMLFDFVSPQAQRIPDILLSSSP